MTHILALAGKKQSGKSTLANFVFGYEMLRHGLTEGFRIRQDGELEVKGEFLDEEGEPFQDWGILDVVTPSHDFVQYAQANIWPFVKIYSFAQTLKDICVEVLALDYDQVHGTDEQKNSLTHLRWENMPGVVTPEFATSIIGGLDDNEIIPVEGRLGHYYDKANILDKEFVIHDPGQMTAREVMQYVGTDVFRKMYDGVWVNNCLQTIAEEKPRIAVISDCRFINETEAVQKCGGKVVHLTRNSNHGDGHASESHLDGFEGFDGVIENEDMTIQEQNDALKQYLCDWGWTEWIGRKPNSMKVK